MYDYDRRNIEKTFDLTISDATKRNLNGYMQEELKYYNTLVNGFNSKIRVLEAEFELLKDNYEKLWLDVAQTGIDIRSFANKPIAEWPDMFKPYANIIVSGIRFIVSDRMMILFDLAATKAIFHQSIRRAMAYEVLHYVRPQAKQIAESDANVTGQMKSPIQMLQPYLLLYKRHVQLINNIVETTYNEESGSTVIKIPYSKEPVIVEGHDLTKIPHNHFIIRQKVGDTPKIDTPWQITIRKGIEKYLLNVTDSNPNIHKKKFK